MSGRVEAIHITQKGGEPMQALAAVQALPGGGLEGDRYSQKQGTYSDHPGAGREVTLIEAEALEQLEAERGIHLDPGETRRNIVTRGVRLNDLVGKEFQVGQVRLRGVRLCEPCNYLEGMTQPGVLEGLVHRGGLRADILTEGMIQIGDEIKE
jgi:MOSC domain-containing protein YiiM